MHFMALHCPILAVEKFNPLIFNEIKIKSLLKIANFCCFSVKTHKDGLELIPSGKSANLTLDSVCILHGLPKIILCLLCDPAFSAAAKRR
jgi:hypothetical protein